MNAEVLELDLDAAVRMLFSNSRATPSQNVLAITPSSDLAVFHIHYIQNCTQITCMQYTNSVVAL